jgi:gliding motility-associated protein GldE
VDEPPSNPLGNTVDLTVSSGIAYPPDFGILVLLLVVAALVGVVGSAVYSIQSADLDKVKDRLLAQKLQSIVQYTDRLWVTGMIVDVSIKTLLFVCICRIGLKDQVVTPLGYWIWSIVAVLLIGDIFPKMIGRRFNVPIGCWSVKLSTTLSALLNPIVTPVVAQYRRWQSNRPTITSPPLEGLVNAAKTANQNGLQEPEKDILKGIATFGTLTVRQVMRPTGEMSAASVNWSFEELINFINKSGFSRIPVFDHGIDTIVGVLYIKDLLPFLEDQEGFAWQSLLRPGFFVRETKKIDLLLKDFQEKRVHMAIVTGDLGVVVGLITLEDLIEEIIGEINDEFDEVEQFYKKLEADLYLFDGKTSLLDFCKTIDIDPKTFEEVKGKSESLAGLFIEMKNGLPRIGDQLTFDLFTFVVDAIDRQGVKRVRVKVHEKAQ